MINHMLQAPALFTFVNDSTSAAITSADAGKLKLSKEGSGGWGDGLLQDHKTGVARYQEVCGL